jgi:glycine/D-amino acid oxidase-like deaminating enzyme
VRPGTHDSRPYLGHHPQAPDVWILNGLGSKGALYAPGCAAYLAEALLEDRPLPEAVDIRRRFRFHPATPPPVDPA